MFFNQWSPLFMAWTGKEVLRENVKLAQRTRKGYLWQINRKRIIFIRPFHKSNIGRKCFTFFGGLGRKLWWDLRTCQLQTICKQPEQDEKTKLNTLAQDRIEFREDHQEQVAHDDPRNVPNVNEEGLTVLPPGSLAPSPQEGTHEVQELWLQTFFPCFLPRVVTNFATQVGKKISKSA